MELITHNFEVRHKDYLEIVHITDTHFGSEDFAEKELRAMVDRIAEDGNSFWTYGGDGPELIRTTDPRFRQGMLPPRYAQSSDIRYTAMEHMLEVFTPIKDKLIGAVEGNHEGAYDKHSGGLFLAEFLANLGVPRAYGGAWAYIDCRVKVKPRNTALNFAIDLHHGWQGGRSDGAFHNEAIKQMARTDAQIILRGHSHNAANSKPIPRTGTNQNRRKLVRRPHIVVNGGCWRYGGTQNGPVNPERLSETKVPTYTEMRGYEAGFVGGPILRLWFDQGRAPGNESRKDGTAQDSRPAGYDIEVVRRTGVANG